MPSSSTHAANGISNVPPIWSSAAWTSAASSGEAWAIADSRVDGALVDGDPDPVDRVGSRVSRPSHPHP